MENLFTLKFQLRKPYNEAESLIGVFNQIIEEGGRCELIVRQFSEESHVLEIRLYRCKNSYVAAGLGARITNKLSTQDRLTITKFNLASIQYCPVKFSIENCTNENKGPKIKIELFENNDIDIQTSLNKQFEFIDSTAADNI